MKLRCVTFGASKKRSRILGSLQESGGKQLGHVLATTQPGAKKIENCRRYRVIQKECQKKNGLHRDYFSEKFGFLRCFRSRISDKFILLSTQVHHNHPDASKEAGASNVLSGSGGFLRPTTDSKTLRKGPK